MQKINQRTESIQTETELMNEFHYVIGMTARGKLTGKQVKQAFSDAMNLWASGNGFEDLEVKNIE